jgi:hypothetical protein
MANDMIADGKCNQFRFKKYLIAKVTLNLAIVMKVIGLKLLDFY